MPEDTTIIRSARTNARQHKREIINTLSKNSTFLMLRRIKRLRPYFTPFYDKYKRSDLTLDNDK
ncbi:hypothetical protein N7447_006748 [Penicillium robsamsonii]|uniref:uncharacterized protein n=1 Tax=Penicillium robsamsonii TaxID=1792511 RepID=UPI002547E1A8|nr:uncharacterized protein N7447_006748 [Penicillium robsamsonii]KAJ5824408.1 hypothetical protein N7447_006748 [Penicillium robsamsonii]